MSLFDRVSIPSTLADQPPPTRDVTAEEKTLRRLRQAHIEAATCVTCGGLATREEVLVSRPGLPSERRVLIRCLANAAKGRAQGQSALQEEQAAARCPVQTMTAEDAPPLVQQKPIPEHRERAERSPDRFTMPQLTCPICSKVFRPRRSAQRLCSSICNDRDRYLREKAERNTRLGDLPASRACEACGSTFAPRRRTQRYCSQRCLSAQYHRRKTASQAPVLSVTVVTCRDCGTQVETIHPGRLTRCPPCQRTWRNLYQRARRRAARGETISEKEAPVKEMRCQDCGDTMVGVSPKRKRCEPCKRALKKADSLARYHRMKGRAPKTAAAYPPLPAVFPPEAEQQMAPPSAALLEALASPLPAPAPALRPCGSCRMFVESPGYDWGTCRRRAPVVSGPDAETVWPAVKSTEPGCGEHSRAVVAPSIHPTDVEVR